MCKCFIFSAFSFYEAKCCFSGNRGEKIYSIDCGEEAATWISRYMLEKDFGLRLGYNDGSHRRDITKTYMPFLRLYPNLSNEAVVSIRKQLKE